MMLAFIQILNLMEGEKRKFHFEVDKVQGRSKIREQMFTRRANVYKKDRIGLNEGRV